MRWGGDEFLVVSRGIDRAGSERLAQRIRDRVRMHDFLTPGGDAVRLSCSVGFAFHPFLPIERGSVGAHQVLGIADRALYLGKMSGRNMWVGLFSTEDTRTERLLDRVNSNLRDAVESGERRGATVQAEIDLGRARVAQARGHDPAPFLDAAAHRLHRWPGRLRERIEAMVDDPHPGVRDERDDPQRLTPREREVLALIAEGLNNASVAEALVLSPKAVAKHINSIFSKLGLGEEETAHRRVKAVLMWLAQ